MAKKIKASGKAVIIIGLAVLLFVVYKYLGPYIIPQGEGQGDVSGLMAGSASPAKNGECIEIGVVTWGGYAGGQYFNNGFKDNPNSRFRIEYDICVNFHVMDDFAASRAAFKAGKMDLMWVTIDAFPTEAGNYGESVKFLFQADWSRGGDAIVAKGDIKAVGNLMGKKIAVAPATPSHTFLLWMLDMAGLSYMDVEIVEVPSAIDAAASFKAGKVDAAVVWSPDDADCVAKVSGSKILVSTKQATHIIADGFMVKESVYKAKKDKLKKLVEGWLKGAAEVNASEANKAKAAKILSDGFGADVDEKFALGAINNVRLTTYGDNLDFFGLNPSYTDVKGKDLYEKMSKVYAKLRLAKNVPGYGTVVVPDFIQSLNLKGQEGMKAETKKTFQKATETEEKAEAVASKPVRVAFPTGSATLDESAKTIIDLKFVEAAKAFPGSRIRIEGNTDSTGARGPNVTLSKKRAQSVVDYLVSTHGMDRNRFVVVGNGPDKPLCPEKTEVCYSKNRRTDFQILQ
jgi:NitT/TauT family transport system substrate-binding protein